LLVAASDYGYSGLNSGAALAFGAGLESRWGVTLITILETHQALACGSYAQQGSSAKRSPVIA
jgi:hypothetical protein